MSGGQSFRSRLLLSFLLVICLALLLPAWYSRHILGRDLPAADVALVFGATLGLAALASLLLARQLSTSVQAMIDVAEAIGRGNYRQRVRISPGREFDGLARAINRMAESIEAHIQTITCQKGQLEAILNGMREGVMVLDGRGRIRATNRALADIVPRAGACEGRTPLEAVMSPELQDACDRVLGAQPSGGDVDPPPLLTLQIELDGHRAYDVSIVRLREADSGLGAVAVFHDISELKRLERVRRDFVANVSHELRTPLTSIKGYAETLLAGAGHDSGTDPEVAKGFLEVILKNANHMTKMVGDLLNLARLEAGRQTFRFGPVNAAASLVSAFRECAVLAEAKGVGLDNRLPPGGVWVEADGERLVQVFRNLLENAIKYGPADRPVTVDCAGGGAMLTFGVRDRGPGIPAKERDRVFERFYRIDKHRTKHSGSSGLGLAIAKHIVERHGGRIWVEGPSDGAEPDGLGAVFRFSLPRADAPRPGPAAPPSPGQPDPQ